MRLKRRSFSSGFFLSFFLFFFLSFFLSKELSLNFQIRVTLGIPRTEKDLIPEMNVKNSAVSIVGIRMQK
jgi:hypothetical protein